MAAILVALASLSSCVTPPGLPFDPVYLHRPDAATFEFIVCRVTEGATIRVEFHARGDRLLETWRADSDSVRTFEEGDILSTDPPPSGFESATTLSAPEDLYTVEVVVGSEVDGNLVADIGATFLGADVTGSEWRDQAGHLVPARC